MEPDYSTLAVNKTTASTSLVMAASNNSLLNAATALFVNDAIDEKEFIAVYEIQEGNYLNSYIGSMRELKINYNL